MSTTITENNMPISDLVELEKLKLFREMTEKKDKKPPEKWWNTDPVKLAIIGFLFYPLLGIIWLQLFKMVK